MVVDKEIDGSWRTGLCILGHVQICLVNWLILPHGDTGGVACEEEWDLEVSYSSFHLLLWISSGHVWMWELDCEEGWEPKNWCFWTAVLEKTLESPWTARRSKGDQSWVFTGRTDAKAETPVLWPPHVKSWLIGKDPDAGRDWGQEEKGMTEDEMAGWHHHLDGHESEWTPGVGDGQGGLACCDSWGCKESDTTERLNWTEQQKLTTL